MRIVFRTTDHPKHVAKSLKKATKARGFEIDLSACQEVAARMFGYSDWHELHMATLTPSDQSSRDEEVGDRVAEVRRAQQIDVLVKAGLPETIATGLVEELKPTGRRKRI